MLTKITLRDGLYSEWNDIWMTRYCKLLCYSISVVMVLSVLYSTVSKILSAETYTGYLRITGLHIFSIKFCSARIILVVLLHTETLRK